MNVYRGVFEQGLEGNHAFCRNPDGDIKPWCWVDHNNFIFGYCQLPVCSATTPPPITMPPAEVIGKKGFGQRPCSSTKFHCPSMVRYSEQR